MFRQCYPWMLSFTLAILRINVILVGRKKGAINWDAQMYASHNSLIDYFIAQKYSTDDVGLVNKTWANYLHIKKFISEQTNALHVLLIRSFCSLRHYFEMHLGNSEIQCRCSAGWGSSS